MAGPVRETGAMIAAMEPDLDPLAYAFVSAAEPGEALELMHSAIATFREVEGLSLVVPHDAAQAAGLEGDPYARITLQVHSALDGVGLTAAVATALAGAGIPCNMVAAFHHDHVFVPLADANAALVILYRLQDEAAGE